MADESNCIGHEPCPACGSRDNLARYDDGHGYCFGCGHYEKGGDEKPARTKERRVTDLIDGEVRALPKRNLSEETCRKWGYKVGEFKGKPCQVATYCDDDGTPVAQKLRFPDKSFVFIGKPKEAGLYGQHLWRDGGKMLVITEGEIDALSVSQLQGNKWPVVSVPNGAQGAAKSVAKSIEWVEKFDKVVLLFDDDEPGRDAAAETAAILSPGKAFIGRIDGFKDANDALVAGQGSKVIDALWGAKVWRPDGLVEIDELIEEAKKPTEMGLPWFLPSLTKATYGRRYGEIYAVGAGTGIGKTDFLTQQAAFDVTELKQKVGLVYLEATPVETAKRVAGKVMGFRFHIPDDGWTLEALAEGLESLRGRAVLYDSWGETAWDVVKAKLRYMAVSAGIRIFYLDHLTAMSDTSNERESIEQLMKELAGLANELQVIIVFVSHLATPDGKPHEEGGRVSIRHFKGSRAIGFWSHFMFGLERDQQADDPDLRKLTVLRVLKDRYTGRSTGTTIGLSYDEKTGRLFECELPKDGGPPAFKDESNGEF